METLTRTNGDLLQQLARANAIISRLPAAQRAEIEASLPPNLRPPPAQQTPVVQTSPIIAAAAAAAPPPPPAAAKTAELAIATPAASKVTLDLFFHVL